MRRASSSALTLLRRRPLSSLISSSVSDASAASSSQFHPDLNHFTQTPLFVSRHANKPRMFSTQTPPPYSEGTLKAGMDDLEMVLKLHREETDLYKTNKAMGSRMEALAHLMKSLELKKRIWGEGSLQLGHAYRKVAREQFCALKFRESLPFCVKALEIHKALLGDDSAEVARDRVVLGDIYRGLNDDEKALEQYQLSLKVLKKNLDVEVNAANAQIRLGRFDEAIDTLKGVLPLTVKDNIQRGMIHVSMSKAFSGQKRLEESKKCLDNACEVLGKDESSFPYGVAVAYMEISSLYEEIDDLENALSVSMKALAMFEKMPEEKNCAGNVSCTIGEILLSKGKAEEAIPYLENATKWLKESYGSEHFIVNRAYRSLGDAYLESDRPQEAAQVFADAAQVVAGAKDLYDIFRIPHQILSITADQNLSRAYAAMGSYELAIKFQKKVVEALEELGPNEEDKLEEARQVLEELKMKKANHGVL